MKQLKCGVINPTKDVVRDECFQYAGRLPNDQAVDGESFRM